MLISMACLLQTLACSNKSLCKSVFSNANYLLKENTGNVYLHGEEGDGATIATWTFSYLKKLILRLV